MAVTAREVRQWNVKRAAHGPATACEQWGPTWAGPERASHGTAHALHAHWPALRWGCFLTPYSLATPMDNLAGLLRAHTAAHDGGDARAHAEAAAALCERRTCEGMWRVAVWLGGATLVCGWPAAEAL